MKFLLLNGASCSGKSTIIKNIMEKKDFFHLSYDSLKWSFSQYEANIHYADVQKVLLLLQRQFAK